MNIPNQIIDKPAMRERCYALYQAAITIYAGGNMPTVPNRAFDSKRFDEAYQVAMLAEAAARAKFNEHYTAP